MCSHKKKTNLQHFVRRSLNSGNKVAGGKCHLLDFSKVVDWVAIEGQFTNRDEGVVLVRPHLVCVCVCVCVHVCVRACACIHLYKTCTMKLQSLAFVRSNGLKGLFSACSNVITWIERDQDGYKQSHN